MKFERLKAPLHRTRHAGNDAFEEHCIFGEVFVP